MISRFIIALTLVCLVTTTSLIGSKAATTAQVAGSGGLVVSASPAALLGVPEFGPGPFMRVARRRTGSASFTVTNHSQNEVSVFCVITSADPHLNAELSPSSPGILLRYMDSAACTLTVSPDNKTSFGTTYIVQAQIMGVSTGYSSVVNVSIPVEVTK